MQRPLSPDHGADNQKAFPFFAVAGEGANAVEIAEKRVRFENTIRHAAPIGAIKTEAPSRSVLEGNTNTRTSLARPGNWLIRPNRKSGVDTMSTIMKCTVLAAGLSLLLSSGASAGECPADKVLKTPRKLESVTDDSKLKGEVVATVDPSGWRGMKGLMLRTRRLTIQPGGFVPTHGHADRPAIIYMISGEVIEHNSTCAVPIVHKAGETIAEFGAGVEHWWENKGTVPVVLTSSDIVPVEMMNDKMMQMP